MTVAPRTKPTAEQLDALARDVMESLRRRAPEGSDTEWLSRRMASLAAFMAEYRKPKEVADKLAEALGRLSEDLERLGAAYPLRFFSEPGMSGDLSRRARELKPLIDAELVTFQQRVAEVESNRKKAAHSERARREAMLDAAWVLLPVSTKTPHRRYFAFHGIDAGLTATGMAKLEALAYWGYFPDVAWPADATTSLYTDASSRSRSGEDPRKKSVDDWQDAVAEIRRALR